MDHLPIRYTLKVGIIHKKLLRERLGHSKHLMTHLKLHKDHKNFQIIGECSHFTDMMSNLQRILHLPTHQGVHHIQEGRHIRGIHQGTHLEHTLLRVTLQDLAPISEEAIQVVILEEAVSAV